MSLMNCYVEPERALVAVDTHVTGGEASKISVLAHANTVTAMRGELLFYTIAHGLLNLSMAQGFDALCAAVPEVLAQSYTQREAINAAQGGQHPFAGIELALVGWSEALGRMQGVRWERWPDDAGFTTTPVNPWSLSPNPGYMPEHAPDTVQRMEAIARDQVQVLRQLPCVVAGGRLLVAEVRRDAITMRTAADLEMN